MSDSIPAQKTRLQVLPFHPRLVDAVLHGGRVKRLGGGPRARALGPWPVLSIPAYTDDPLERVAWRFLVALGEGPEGPRQALTVWESPVTLLCMAEVVAEAEGAEQVLLAGAGIALAVLVQRRCSPPLSDVNPHGAPGAPRGWSDVCREVLGALSTTAGLPVEIRDLACRYSYGDANDIALAVSLEALLVQAIEEEQAVGQTPEKPRGPKPKQRDRLATERKILAALLSGGMRMSKKELAAEAGVTRSTVSKYMKDPQLDLLRAAAAEYHKQREIRRGERRVQGERLGRREGRDLAVQRDLRILDRD